MAIATSTTSGGNGAPFAKLNRLGDKVQGAFASDPLESKRQKRNYKTGEPEFKKGKTDKDGKPIPALEEIMHFVAMPETTARIGTADAGFEPIEAGTHIRYSVSGFEWKQVIDQRDALPAYSGFKAGQPCSGDVYEIELTSWSVATDNAAGAEKAGFTVVDGRIIMRTEEDREKYILHQARTGGNSSTGKDVTITIRRPRPDEKRWEQAADELYLTKPWLKVAAGGGADREDRPEDVEPF
jgi:hypothetical protein